MVYRSDYPIWVTTGGGMEPEESPKKAALREAEEETGFKIKITRAVGIYYTKEKGLTRKSYLFEGRVTSGKFRPEFPGCKGKWFPVNKLPLSMIDLAKKKILDCLKHQVKPFRKKKRPLSLRNNLHLLLLHPLSTVKFILSRVKPNLSLPVKKFP